VGAKCCNVHHHAHFSHIRNLQLLSLSANWHLTLHSGHIWLISRLCTWHFMDWLHGTVHMPGMKTGLWFGNFSNILCEILLLLNCPITVCDPLLYHTCCINAQKQDGKIAKVKTSFTAYNLPPNFHFVRIVLIHCISIVFFNSTCSALLVGSQWP